MNPDLATAPLASSAGHPSTLRLHQLRLGELEAAAAEAIERHLEGCARCAGRHQHQRAVEQAFRRLPMPPALATPPGLRERISAWLGSFGGLLVPALAAALVSVVLLPRVVEGPLSEGSTEVGPAVAGVVGGSEPASAVETRVKGALPGLQVWVQTNGSARPLYTNEALGASARVQLRFNPRGHRFVTFAGRDGAGRVEVYGTVPATNEPIQSAPFALTLDDSPGTQRFYAIFTDIRPAPDDLDRSLASDPVALSGAEVEQVVIPKKR